MFIDPLEQWLWHTPTPLPKEPSHSIQAEVLQDVHKLNDLGRLADPRLIDFWQNTAVTNDQHTPFRYERLTIAIATLALIAIRRVEMTAVDVLRHLSHAPQMEVRELAVHYLGRAFTEAGRPFPDPILNEITLIATHDDGFAPRFQARRILQVAQEPVPLDNPGGVYDLKVMPLRNRRIYRTIAIRVEKTLRDLQRFIQHAFEWDNDHLCPNY